MTDKKETEIPQPAQALKKASTSSFGVMPIMTFPVLKKDEVSVPPTLFFKP